MKIEWSAILVGALVGAAAGWLMGSGKGASLRQAAKEST